MVNTPPVPDGGPVLRTAALALPPQQSCFFKLTPIIRENRTNVNDKPEEVRQFFPRPRDFPLSKTPKGVYNGAKDQCQKGSGLPCCSLDEKNR